VFASGDRLEDVTAQWISRFNEHEAKALAEVVNLVLQASGCDLRINEDDISDPDNAPNRVAEIQEEFQQVGIGLCCIAFYMLTIAVRSHRVSADRKGERRRRSSFQKRATRLLRYSDTNRSAVRPLVRERRAHREHLSVAGRHVFYRQSSLPSHQHRCFVSHHDRIGTSCC
jgi:hypothetical protein